MRLRGFRKIFFNATRDSFKPVKTIPIIMAAAIMFARTAAAQTSATNALEPQPFFSANLSGFNEVIFVAGSAGPPLVAPALRGAIQHPARGSSQLSSMRPRT